ncbi:uncharacterized protein BHQ10_001761 [Talaromyces amestolkiae]|uniref:Uncharacterized protein n=1 Tax=Talaromyces amestolkiae TaxID=1196081 RepID=A0A364KQD2_TALAM|nr:uncharacterized protein BHQ10_001761 [Talaromyces amestolkiae]RAO65749.1 hypothetical protein BHQ10_001761 [Talaromyces amestolkiae]
MPKTLQPYSMRLVIDWFELEDDAYPDVGLPLGITVFVELQVEPDSVFTVMRDVEGVINLESTWYKGVTKIADRAPASSVEDVEDQDTSLKTEEEDHNLDARGDSYSADDLDEGESFASSTRSSDTVRPSTIRPKLSRIPIRKSGTDGTFDDLDLELDMPPSPTLSSQDSLPWYSTKDTGDNHMDDENGPTGIDLDDLFTDLEDIYHPFLRYENGNITLHAAREVEPGFYQVEIAFYRHFVRDTQGWYGVDLCDVVKSCPPIPGKLVFNIQDHPSLYPDIIGPDDLHDMEDGSREATFDPREEPYLAFWAWTHATYLEFWGDGKVDNNYYDDLIAPNAYLDSDELVDYVDFMFKTRDDEEVVDGASEMAETPEKVAQSKQYISPIADQEDDDEDEEEEEQEEKDGQVDGLILGDVTEVNVDHVVSGLEERPMSPIPEEEECESGDDEDVIWEDVPIPGVQNFEYNPEEGPETAKKGGVEDMLMDNVTTPNVKDDASQSEETVIEEEAHDVILKDVTAPYVDNVTLESEELPKPPTFREKAESSTSEDITSSHDDNPPPLSPDGKPPADDSKENNLKLITFYHPLPPPPLPTYAEALEGYEKYQAMMTSRAILRRRAIFCLSRILPALFVLVFTICACIGGPPTTISTPTATLQTVRYYANHLGGMGYNALMQVPTFADFGAYHQRDWYEDGVALLESGNEGEDLGDVEVHLWWKLVDETLEIAGIADSPAVPESAEPVVESVVSPSRSELDAKSPPPEIAAEALTPNMSTPVPAPDVKTPVQPETASSFNATTAALSLAIKPPPLPRLCPNRHRQPNTPYPPDCPLPSPPKPALTILADLTQEIFRHIACSTSPICTISRISDKYEHPGDIFARFQCDGKGGWEPETRRDGFDWGLGWVPDECRLL